MTAFLLSKCPHLEALYLLLVNPGCRLRVYQPSAPTNQPTFSYLTEASSGTLRGLSITVMSDVAHLHYPDNRPVVYVEISESVFGDLERLEDIAPLIPGLDAVVALDKASEKMVQKQRLNSVSSLVSFLNTICGITTPTDSPL